MILKIFPLPTDKSFSALQRSPLGNSSGLLRPLSQSYGTELGFLNVTLIPHSVYPLTLFTQEVIILDRFYIQYRTKDLILSKLDVYYREGGIFCQIKKMEMNTCAFFLISKGPQITLSATFQII